MDKTTEDRIIKDAVEWSTKNEAEFSQRSASAYIAGATAENSRAQGLADFLNEIAEESCDYESTNFAKALHSPECRACKAKEVLQQWKGEKEVENEG